MDIKLLKTTVVGGKACVIGAVVDATDREGRFLINIGKAVAYTAPKAKKEPAKKKAPANKSVSVDELETR